MRTALGAMTGTSIDALDLALVEIEGLGLEMRARFVRGWSFPLPDELKHRLRAIASDEPVRAESIATGAHELGRAHADAIASIGAEIGGGFDLVAIHGQTVFHRPPVSVQLLNPWPIARVAGCPVVFDLRGSDLAAGGQGAPITPLADWIVFRDATRTRAIVNLGGFCNITILPPGDPGAIRGFDVCACNQVLDAVARTLLNAPYDDAGASALSGTPHPGAAKDLRILLTTQRGLRRSLGSGDEASAWLDAWRDKLSPADACASAVRAIGATIGDACADADEILLAGGGTRNRGLTRAIAEHASVPVRSTDELGVPASYRESALMGVLGVLSADGVPITLPQVTGVTPPAPLSGAWIHPS